MFKFLLAHRNTISIGLRIFAYAIVRVIEVAKDIVAFAARELTIQY